MNSLNFQIVIGISIGAIFGALLRWWLGFKFNGMYEYFYCGTFIANITACFIMGLFLNLPIFPTLPSVVKLGVLTGFLGSLSTFSTLIAEVHSSMYLREWLKVIVNFNIQVITGLGTFHCGRMLGVILNARY